MKVRLAKKEEISRISKIVSALDTKHYKFSDKKKILGFIKKKSCYVSLENDEILGAMCLDLSKESCKIYSIVSKKKGCGKLLVNRAVEVCKKKKVTKLWCWSLIRYKAGGFYHKVGFEEQFLLKKQWYGEDCYFFGKRIKIKN